MWVVKIGGSLETAPGLRRLLALLADFGHAGIIIAPGGGRFADQVRVEQRATGMDDATAHRLAIRAMELYAAALCRLDARLYPLAEPGAADAVYAKSGVPVWLPGKMLAGRTDIPASWRVTSDSLALWLAGEINAEALILVKSARNRRSDAQGLAAAGYLDDYFPEMMKKTGVETVACIGIEELELLRQALVNGELPAETILTDARAGLG